jgi:hypothetical protein
MPEGHVALQVGVPLNCGDVAPSTTTAELGITATEIKAGAQIVMDAEAFSDAPFRVADSKRLSEPTEFPAVNVVALPVVVEMFPVLLLKDHE